VLIHQRRPFQGSQRPEKEVRMLRAYARPTRRKAVNEFAQPLPLGHEVPLIDFFANRPSSRPINIRRGNFSPTAISIAAEQCASACAGFILPHSRSLSGLSRATRSFTSSTVAASKRF